MLAEQQEHSLSPGSATASPTIHDWSVMGYDRIVGMVHADAQSRGKAIMTSPVLRVSFLGGARRPVALTQSGSLYALGDPSDSFGAERARDFLRYKAGGTEPTASQPAPRLPTSLMKLES